MIAEVELERSRRTDIQYARKEYVIVGETVPSTDQIQLSHPDLPFIDAWAYHGPLINSFRSRRRVTELPESDFDPDDLP